jgi:hypothetical protein
MEMLSEVIAIFNRWNKKLLRQPILIFFNLIQPLVWFLLFTQAFSAIGNIPSFQMLTGTSSYITFFTAAVIIQTIASSALNAGIGLVNDFDSGFMDKMRVAPINKSSILFGVNYGHPSCHNISYRFGFGSKHSLKHFRSVNNFLTSCLVRNCLVRHILIRCAQYKERGDHSFCGIANYFSAVVSLCVRNAYWFIAKLGATSGAGQSFHLYRRGVSIPHH